jgi:hypothetical protein
VVLFKENHTQPTEAATLDGKSGEAEGSAVCHSCAPPLPANNLHQSSTESSWKHHPSLVIPSVGWASGPPKVMKKASVRQLLSIEPLPPPLSSRAKPRDLQLRGPFVETRTSILKQNCHLACPCVPWDRNVPGFPASLHSADPRVRLSSKKAAFFRSLQSRARLDYAFSASAWSAGISSPAQIFLAVQGAADPAQNGSLAGNPNGSQAAEQR